MRKSALVLVVAVAIALAVPTLASDAEAEASPGLLDIVIEFVLDALGLGDEAEGSADDGSGGASTEAGPYINPTG